MEITNKNFSTGEETKKEITNKVKRVVLDPQFIFNFLYSNRKVFVYNELPEGCKYEGCYYDYQLNKINLFISNPLFEEIDEGAVIPEFEGEILVKEIPDEQRMPDPKNATNKPDVDLKNEIKKGGKIKK